MNKQSQKQPQTEPLNEIDPHKMFIEDQNHCALCGSQLEIQATSYLENQMVREEAYCKKCDLKTRVKDHHMH